MFVKAPFTQQQAARMNAYQEMGIYHPYTCPQRGDGKHTTRNGVLLATTAGWICLDCPYVQETVHEYVIDDDFHRDMHAEYNRRQGLFHP